jgi:polyisoprenoid-binding protein YceI
LRARNDEMRSCGETPRTTRAIVHGVQTTTVASASNHATTSARWILDPGHSAVGFSVRHLMITNVRGEFERFRAEVAYDPDHPEATRIEATIDVPSLNTREERRDADLRSPLFFDAERYPEIRFVSTSARSLHEDALEVTGELTIRGVTREVTLSIRDIASTPADIRGNPRIGATASTKIQRSDFGMTWNKVLDAGGVVVADAVAITLDVSLVKAT